jgi:hypothetical protein
MVRQPALVALEDAAAAWEDPEADSEVAVALVVTEVAIVESVAAVLEEVAETPVAAATEVVDKALATNPMVATDLRMVRLLALVEDEVGSVAALEEEAVVVVEEAAMEMSDAAMAVTIEAPAVQTTSPWAETDSVTEEIVEIEEIAMVGMAAAVMTKARANVRMRATAMRVHDSGPGTRFLRLLSTASQGLSKVTFFSSPHRLTLWQL